MGALTRKEKLDKVLEDNIDKWMSARQLVNEIAKRWKVTGFSSARSMGLFLRRYKFKKEGKQYYIEKDKVKESKTGPYGNKENR